MKHDKPDIILSVLALAVAMVLLCAAAGFATDTYYIDFISGSDANNGTSKETPWQHHPYMTGWTGSYSHAAGDSAIFKGGVTWDSTCFTMTISVGGGNTGKKDYYGVDKTWYTGEVWTRPIWDNQWSNTTMVWIKNDSIMFHWIEAKNITYPNTFGRAIFSLDGCIKDIYWNNCYIHGWVLDTMLGLANPQCGGIVCGCEDAVNKNTWVDSCEIHNLEWSGNPVGYIDSIGVRSCGDATAGIAKITNSHLHDAPTALVHTKIVDNCRIHDIDYPIHNLYWPTAHTNAMFVEGDSYITNNVMWHINALAYVIACPCWAGDGDHVMHFQNNVFIHLNGQQTTFQITLNHSQGDPLTDTCGAVYLENNTFAADSSMSNIIYLSEWLPGKTIKKLFIKNNHFISNSNDMYLWNADIDTLDTSNNVYNSFSVAKNDGYTVADSFAPISTSTLTKDLGVTLSNVLTDRLGNSRSAPYDVGAYEIMGLINRKCIITIR